MNPSVIGVSTVIVMTLLGTAIRMVFQHYRRLERCCPNCRGTRVERWHERRLYEGRGVVKGSYTVDCTTWQKCLDTTCYLSKKKISTAAYLKQIQVDSWYPNHWIRHWKYRYLLKDAPDSSEVAVRTA